MNFMIRLDSISNRFANQISNQIFFRILPVLDSINEAKILTESILGLELEGLDVAKYSLLTQLIELSIGTRFNSWTIAEHYLKEFER